MSSLLRSGTERTWSGHLGGGPPAPLVRGSVHISGTALDADSCWFATVDRLGWTTLALYSGPNAAARMPAIRGAMRESAGKGASPGVTACAIREAAGGDAGGADLAIARVGTHGPLVELMNVSQPTLVQWSAQRGLTPFEPLHSSLESVRRADPSDVLLLHSGAAIVMATRGLLRLEASWAELRGFVRGVGLDPLGGTLSDVPAGELTRLVTALPPAEGPRAMVVFGVPAPARRVA